jgi:hypothetical protein
MSDKKNKIKKFLQNFYKKQKNSITKMDKTFLNKNKEREPKQCTKRDTTFLVLLGKHLWLNISFKNSVANTRNHTKREREYRK